MPRVLVSACLLGRACRYDGRDKFLALLHERFPADKGWEFVPVCPEELGGLGTPRPAATLTDDDLAAAWKQGLPEGTVIRVADGTDVTAQFRAGAEAALAAANASGGPEAVFAILTDGSPSCGVARTSRAGSRSPGMGATASLLAARGYRVFGHESPDTWPRESTTTPAAPYADAQAIALPGVVPLFRAPSVDSTNDWARSLAAAGQPMPFAVMADAQVAGRGRGGSTWESPPGTGLYLSWAVEVPVAIGPALTTLTAIAAADAIQQVGGRPLRVKWPNDLHVRGIRPTDQPNAKVAGILAESSTTGDGANVAVTIGIGINLWRAQKPPKWAADVGAASIWPDRPQCDAPTLARLFLNTLTRLSAATPAAAAERMAVWSLTTSWMRGLNVTFDAGDRKVRGELMDTRPDGMCTVLIANSHKTEDFRGEQIRHFAVAQGSRRSGAVRR
jgi:biotin-[acetyl-CoA-carboxylase] ligase BirA-like protein